MSLSRVLLGFGFVRAVILIPVFNDWDSVAEVIPRLDRAFASANDSAHVLLVDDGSAAESPQTWGPDAPARLEAISVLRLEKNLGHQRALAVGLCHVAEKMKCDAVVIMDGDGEDKPEDVVRLIEKMKSLPEPAIVFAERSRRSESVKFRVGYIVYRGLHYLLTGLSIRVGNFSVIPSAYLEAIVVDPMLWNHYAASVMRGRLPIATVPMERGARIRGVSRHNFVALVVHGLSALACYGEIIGVRLIMVSGVLLVLAFLGLGVLLGLKFFTTLTVPGWTSLSLCLLIILIVQIATLVSNFTMQLIGTRSVQPFLPIRDYSWFVSSFKNLYRNEHDDRKIL